MRLMLAIVLATACGGGGKKQAVEPTGEGGEGGEAGADEGAGEEEAFCPPETIDQIEETFRAKKKNVGRCYLTALDAGQVSRTKKGALVINVKISPAGRATDVEIAEDTLECDDVCQCVVELIKGWEFPGCPTEIPYTYVYQFGP